MKSIDRYFLQSEFIRILSLLLLLGGLCGQSSSAQNYETLYPGVEYARVEQKIGDDPVKINLLRLDLTKVRLDVHHAFDKAIGVEPTSAIAARHNAIAAINAGFFRLDKSEFAGDAAGLLMIDGDLLSESERGRITINILNRRRRTEIFFGHRDAQAWFGYGELRSQIKLSGVNRERKEGEIILYDRYFGNHVPAADGTRLVLTNCKRTIVDKVVSQTCRNLDIVDSTKQSAIPSGGYVIALGSDDRVSKRTIISDLKLYLSSSQARRSFRIRVETLPADGHVESEDATNGVPQLITNGRIDITWEREKASKSFAETRHPRTAVAKLKDGKFLMMTVDGRQPGVSVGMNLQELAEYLLSLGATDAMNLDGGGSTTMFVDGKVVTTPSDKEGERKVSDAIVVTLRKKSR